MQRDCWKADHTLGHHSVLKRIKLKFTCHMFHISTAISEFSILRTEFLDTRNAVKTSPRENMHLQMHRHDRGDYRITASTLRRRLFCTCAIERSGTKKLFTPSSTSYYHLSRIYIQPRFEHAQCLPPHLKSSNPGSGQYINTEFESLLPGNQDKDKWANDIVWNDGLPLYSNWWWTSFGVQLYI